MRKIRPYLVGATMAALALLAVNGVAYAATGSALILGHTNGADRATGVKRTTRGPALGLNVKSGSPPLAVNSSKQVAHLNADLVDGEHASDLETHVIKYVIPTLGSVTNRANVNLTGLAHGLYQVTYSMTHTVNAVGNTVGCYLSRDGGSSVELLSYGAPAVFGTFSTANASGVIDFRTGSAVTLTCFALNGGGTFNFANETTNEDTVTLVKVAGVTTRTNATPLAAAAPRSHTAGSR